MSSAGWTRFKELSSVIASSVVQKQQDAFFSLDKALRKHKPDFISLLKNPPRNSAHESQVKASVKQGLKVASLPHPLTLPQDFIDESLILSDILDLNEIAAVELLLAGEQHLPNFPTLTRGLVAVLLYYDSKRSLITSLRSLIQARDGILWTLGLGSSISDMITKFTDQLFRDGLVDEILKQVAAVDVDKELENLSRGQAIKDNKHKQQIVDLIVDTKHALMDCLFYWSCQTPFDKYTMLKIIKELKKVSATSEGYQPLDYTSLALFFTLTASFSVGPSDHGSPDAMIGEDHSLPVFTDRSLIATIHEAINKQDWSNPPLGAAVQFAWGVFLRECSPFDALSDLNELQEDEDIIDAAIDNEAFHFIRQAIITSPFFLHEEYYVRHLHHIITSFIVLMPNKVIDLRNSGDEEARQELMRTARGAPPSQHVKHSFGELMKLVGDLYLQDPNGLNLSLEYWAPVEEQVHSGMTPQVPHRQLSLLKFIHHCSELLPPALFTSFMTMLIGLSNSEAAAPHCFNFLKSNSTSLGGGGPSASFSLDHFFLSMKQYYYGLKEEARVKHTPSGCAISPQEVEGLRMVLKLIKTIAKLDENACIVMYENQAWLPVATLFGLIGCAIPRSLKSEIFLTLGEFARRSPEIAASMWQTLENAQVLNTVPNIPAGSSGQYNLGPYSQEGSIQIELEEIEAKEGDYLQTRAFLTLLDAMTDVTVPSSLGLGHRVPGFQPYLEFVRDSVFLKFDTRTYKDPQEKWLVASASMEVIYKLLSSHEVIPNDFVEQMYEVSQGRMVPLPSQPGHVILHHLLNDSALLRKLLFIVDECCSLLSDVESSTEAVAHAALLALKILESSLFKQEAFLSVLRESSSHSVMATPLDELLLGINPKSRKADYYISIAKYVSFSSCSPELALTAVRILCVASRSVTVSKEILNTLTSVQGSCVSVLHGFVEHLEWEDPSPPVSTGSTQGEHLTEMEEGVADSVCPEDVRRRLKEEILELLITCVQCPVPNIGHLLLGYIQPPFERRKKLSEASLQDPGVLGSLKTCLHSVLQLVSIGSDPRHPMECHTTQPKLAQTCYRLIYLLCSNKDLSVNTMRYLRNNHDFFHAQLSHIPFPWLQDLEERDVAVSLTQQAWILCSVALEIRMTALKNQKSHFQRLVTLLLKSTTLTQQFDESTGQLSIWSTAVNLDFDLSQKPDLIQDGRRKVLTILDLVSFASLPQPALQLQFFDSERTEEVMRLCETRVLEEGTLTYIDIKTLHRLLMNELNSLQGTAVVSQKPFILQEIDSILTVAVERNRVQEVMHCQQLLMDSWCRVVEIMMGVVNNDSEKEDVTISVLFEIIQDLLLKVNSVDANSLTAAAHGVIFTLMAYLRQILSDRSDQSDKSQTTPPLSSGPLQSIFRGLLDNLVKCPAGMQRLRAHLYSSLLSYLQMTQEKQPERNVGLWRLEQDIGLTSANLSVLSECGEGLMDVVCRDACNGHDVPKMLALSLLDSIVSLDTRGTWLQYMTTRGYLQKVCSSLLWEDETLQGMLHPHPEALRPLYIYESKMAFLSRVASTSVGAKDLVSLNCLANFNECKYIDLRPGNHGAQSSSQATLKFIPPISVRYLQLLVPVLRLLLALLTTPGPHLKDATNQVLLFIQSHVELFISVLKDGGSYVTMGTLQELSLVTAVICQCKAGQDWMVDPSLPNLPELIHIQTLLLSLLPNFITPSKWRSIAQDVTKNETGGRDVIGGPVWEEAYSLSQQVCSNLMTFCQNAITATGSEFSVNFYRILFTPDLSVAISPAPGVHSRPGPPSLGHLVSSLKEVADSYFVNVESLQQIEKKVDGVQNMTSEEMKQLIPDVVSERHSLSLFQLQKLSRANLQRSLEGKKQQIAMSIYILEHMLCVLWRHLQFFLIHCKPTELGGDLTEESLMMRPPMRRLHGSTAASRDTHQGGAKERFDVSHLSEGITANDLEQLKLGVVKCLSDSLFKKLLDINNALSQSKDDDSSVGFIHALVRRIKKLLKLKAAMKPVLHLS